MNANPEDANYSKLPGPEKMVARLNEAAEVIAFMSASVISPGDEPAYLLNHLEKQNDPTHEWTGVDDVNEGDETSLQTEPLKRARSKASASQSTKDTRFEVGEYVVYPAHGVGQIISIESQALAGISLELFVISFEKDKITLRVPTNKATDVGIRALSSPDVINQAMKTLKGKAKVKRAMWSRRAQEYEQKINSGDLIAIAEVVRDLHRADDQREQSYSERQLYEAALERLTHEIAAIESTDKDHASKEIFSALKTDAA